MTAVADAIGDRLAAIDWSGVDSSLDSQGFAHLPVVLDPDECQTLAGLYPQDARFRSRIDMSRFRFGVGEYKYFAAPLPPLVQSLREGLYARLAPTANRWRDRLRRKPEVRSQKSEFPPSLDDFLARCHEAGQTRPTPLLLSYAAGGYNCLHQDIYGESRVSAAGGVRAQQRGDRLRGRRVPARRAASESTVARPCGAHRAGRRRSSSPPASVPRRAARGDYRVTMRHGVSTVTAGLRMTLGVIFHDAR